MSGFYEYERIRHKNRDEQHETDEVQLKIRVNRSVLGDMLQVLSKAGYNVSLEKSGEISIVPVKK